MSDTPTLKVNNTVLALLAVVALLLAAIAGILLANGGDTAAPTTATTQPTLTGEPADIAAAPAPAADFDPATATQVPDGLTLEDYAATYYEAVLVGDYETAYAMQPVHKQTSSVEDFAAQLQGYGIADYAVTGSQDMGEQYIVIVDQMTGSFGTFENQWTFISVDDVWYVQDKAVTGMK